MRRKGDLREERHLPPEKRLSELTAREREVLRFLGEWKRKDEIASLLGISPRTVEAHRNRIRQKLGFSSSLELLRFGVRQRSGS